MSFDLSRLGMTEIIRLQNALSQELTRRFEKPLAVAFSDIVGSTLYFTRFGDEAGRKLQQRHIDLLQEVLPKFDGRIVDTAGDGAFFCFPKVDPAADALIEFQNAITRGNTVHPRDHQLSIRIGLHWGCVLTDGVQVTGDAVNLCARIASSTEGGEIRLTRETAQEFSDVIHRLSCRPLPSAELKDISRPVELMAFEWRDRRSFPAAVRIEETGVELPLPKLDTISFGRLKESDGWLANDVILEAKESTLTMAISRWHFELRRKVDGFVLRQISNQVTEVDGQVVAKGAEVPIRPESVVRVSGILTLKFVPSSHPDLPSDYATIAAI